MWSELWFLSFSNQAMLHGCRQGVSRQLDGIRFGILLRIEIITQREGKAFEGLVGGRIMAPSKMSTSSPLESLNILD